MHNVGSQVAHITQRTDGKQYHVVCVSIINLYIYDVKNHKDMLTIKRYEFYTKLRKV